MPGIFGSQPHPVFHSFLLLALTSTILIKRFYLNFLQEGEFSRANEWPFILYLLKGKKTYFFPQYHCLKAGFFFEINNSFKSCRKSVTWRVAKHIDRRQRHRPRHRQIRRRSTRRQDKRQVPRRQINDDQRGTVTDRATDLIHASVVISVVNGSE